MRLPSSYSATNGIVIATEKKSPSILVDESAIERVAVICPNIGIVYSGMGPDFRTLVAKARQSAQAYWKIYNEYPPTKVLVQEVATIMQKATQSGLVSHTFQTCWTHTFLWYGRSDGRGKCLRSTVEAEDARRRVALLEGSCCSLFSFLQLCSSRLTSVLLRSVQQRSSAVRCLASRRRLGLASRPVALPGRPVRLVLGVEGIGDRQEHGQRQDLPGEAVG